MSVHLTVHEICGKVLSVGNKVPEDKGPRVGDVVVVYPWPGCGQCETCSTENWQLCDERSSAVVDGRSPPPSPDVSENISSNLASFQVSRPNHNLAVSKFCMLGQSTVFQRACGRVGSGKKYCARRPAQSWVCRV